eukprot:8542337-Pyramimonas_sp.AAC.1
MKLYATCCAVVATTRLASGCGKKRASTTLPGGGEDACGRQSASFPTRLRPERGGHEGNGIRMQPCPHPDASRMS